MNYYYLNRNNQPVGPLTEKQLKTAILSEPLLPDTKACTEGADAWVCLSTLPGMAAVFEALENSSMGGCPKCGKGIIGFIMPPTCPHCGYEIALPVDERESLWKNFVFALKKSFTLRGRATRREFWSFFLFSWVISTVLGFLFEILMMAGLVVCNSEAGNELTPMLVLYIVACLVLMLPVMLMCIPYVSVSVRRLHDIGASGWWIFIAFIIFFVPYLAFLIPVLADGEIVSLFFPIAFFGLFVIPVGVWFRVIVSHFQDTQRGANKYGPSSKYPR